MKAEKRKQYIANTQNWIDLMVIKENLCPFAKRVFDGQLIQFAVSEAKTEDALWRDLHEQMALLASQTMLEDKLENYKVPFETTMLIHPFVLRKFDDYMLFYDNDVEDMIGQLELEGVIQVAPFHPEFQFDDLEKSDPSNYTNRSPYPMLHLLREKDVTKAVDTHPDVDAIPLKNIEHLKKLGQEGIDEVLKKIKQ